MAVAPTLTKWAEVDVRALRDNTHLLCEVAGPSVAVMAMVKAAGYGHGAMTAARAALAGGATWLGVSSIPEAEELRRDGITARLLNVGWSTAAELSRAVVAGIDVTVFDTAGVALAAEAAASAGRPARVHWKIDSGMGRLGTRTDGMAAVFDALRGAGDRVDVVGLFTHFASADGDSLSFAEQQLDSFLATAAPVRERFPYVLLHAANSAAMLRLTESRLDLVRPGIAIYGYPPIRLPSVDAVRPALAVRALVSQVKVLAAGDTVGYGREWRAERPSLIATVGAGYGDGVDRRTCNNGRVIVGGALCPIVGRVSMDQLSVDVSDADVVRTGDVVTLIGRDGGQSITAADVAARIGTISYEVLCSVSARVPRVLVNTDGALV